MQKAKNERNSTKKSNKDTNFVRNFNKPADYDALPIAEPEENLFNRSVPEPIDTRNKVTYDSFLLLNDEDLLQ